MAATLDDSRPLLESGDEEEDVIYGDVEKEEKVEGEKEREGRRVRRERRGEGGGDPVLEAIGEFGPYQAWLCCVGLLMNLVHAWLSLSLKFVGMRPRFRCSEGGDPPQATPEGERDECLAYSSSSNSSFPCSSWLYDESQFGGSIVERWDLVCARAGEANVAQSVFFAGCLVGVFLAGQGSDRWGRKRVTLGLMASFIATACLGGLVTSFPLWLCLRFLVGAASIGMVTVRYTIQVEMIGSSWRSWANCVTSLGWVGGYMTLPVLAYIMTDMRQLEVVIGLSLAPLLLLIAFCHPESPKWLLTVGSLKEASLVLSNVASWNRRPPTLRSSLSSLPSLSSSPSSSPSEGLSSLLSYPRQLRRLVLMCLCWFAFGMAYFGIALHTPEFGSNVFLVFFLGGLMDLPTLLLAPGLLNWAGRRPCMAGGLLVGASCLVLSALVPPGIFYKEWPVVTLAILGKVGVGLAFDTGYVWSTEIFPTVIRNSALSSCSSAARLGAIAAPLLANLGEGGHPQLPMAVYGLVCLGAGLLALALGPETRGARALPDTLAEGELWGQGGGKEAEEEEEVWGIELTPAKV